MKLKQFLALAALAVTSVGSVHAQEAGTYYIQNVETGKWLAPGNSWGTQASVLDHADYWKLAKVSDGVYTLESVVSNGGSSYYLSGTYCDGGATNLYFTAIDGKDNTYSISTADGSAYITANTGNSIVVNDAKDANSNLAQWKLYSESDMATLLATASAANPIDATFLIKDHDLGRNNRDYSSWSNTGATAPKSSANNAATTIYSVEAYKTAFDVNQTVSNLPKGTYAVYVNGMFRQEESTPDYPYVYANDTKVTFPIVTNGENNMQAAAESFVAGKYLSAPAYVTIEEGGSIKIGAKTVGNKCWSIFKSFHLYYYGDCTIAEAMGENADLSKLIVNNSFENGSAVGWVNTGISSFVNNNDNIGGKDGKYYIEAYQPDGDREIKQTIKNLIPGVYQITVHGRARSMIDPQVYATVGESTEKTFFDNDVTKDYSVVTYVNEGEDLTIGAKCTNTSTGARWFALDNFRLTYVGEDFPEYTLATGKMNTSVAQAQADAETAFSNNKSVASYNALLSAIDAAKASVEMYAANSVALEAQKALIDATNVYNAEGFAAYNTAYETALAAYDDGTATTAVVNPTIATGWHASTAYNFLLTPWKLGESACNEFANALYINTWSNEGSTDGSNFTVPFFEYWVADAEKLGNNTLTGTVTGLDNGLYSATALVRVRATDGVDATDATGISLSVNGGTAVDATEGTQVGETQFTLAEVTAEGLVKDGNLNIAFNVADANISWLSFKNVKYTKVRDLTPEEAAVVPTAIALDKTEATLTAAENTVTLTPTFTPENATETVVWETSNANVATVSDGVVTGVAPGTATITIKSTLDENVKATCEVTVEYSETAYETTIEAIDTENKAAINVSTLSSTNLIKNGSFEYPNAVANWTAANNTAMTIGNFQIGEEEGNHYLKATANVGGGDAKSIGTAWAIEAGKTYVFSYKVKNGSNGNSEFHKVSLTNTLGTETKQISDNATPVTTSWTTVSYQFTNSDNYQYVQFRGRWLGNSVCFDDFYLAEVTETKQIGNVQYAIGQIPTTNIGTGVFQYSQDAIDATNALVKGTATVEDVENAVEAMTTLNAPVADARYTIKNVSVGFAYKDKSLTYIAGGRNDQGGYGIKYMTPSANYAQAFIFTPVEGEKNTYTLSQIDNYGEQRYIALGSAYTGNNEQIRTITDADKAAKFEIVAMTDEGNWQIKNVAANKLIGSTGNDDLYTSGSNYRMVITEATKATATLKVTDAKWGTFIAPFDAEIPEGVIVYTALATEGSDELTLTPVEDGIKANTAYIVNAESEVSESLSGWGLAKADSYKTESLTGVYTKSYAPGGSFILQNQNGEVGFYEVETDNTRTVGANRCYLTDATSSAKHNAFILTNPATAIEGLNAMLSGNVEGIYNAAGVKQNAMQKGLNIVKTADGKTVKVMVK